MLGLESTGFVDYGFGYRDCVDEGFVNLLNYETDDDAEENKGKFLPLRSELAYKKRRGLSAKTIPRSKNIKITLNNGMIKSLRRKDQMDKGTDTWLDK